MTSQVRSKIGVTSLHLHVHHAAAPRYFRALPLSFVTLLEPRGSVSGGIAKASSYTLTRHTSRLLCGSARCAPPPSEREPPRYQEDLLPSKIHKLPGRLRIESIDTYVARRQPRWAGHVARMDMARLPRKILSSWVRHPRPTGAPQFTYARGLHKGSAW